MTERYPIDTELLAAAEDTPTGVQYIPTGTSPYILEFRRLVHRMLRAFERANDLRVYQDGDATFGVRPGICRVNDQAVDFAGVENQAVTLNATTYVWIDDAGAIQTSTTSFPTTATTYLGLAIITADSDAITSVDDRRGEAFLQSPTAATLGLTATADEINQALDGINPTVSALTLNALTAGALVANDPLHTHIQSPQDVAGTASFTFRNDTSDSQGNYAIVFSLPNLTNDDTALELDSTDRWLQQRRGSTTYHLLGAATVQHYIAGNITATLTDQMIGCVPVDGEVTAVVLSIADNIVSSDSSDGISLDIKVNDSSILTTKAQLTANAGSGFRCTDQGDGTSAVITAGGQQDVTRGDILTCDLTYTANGTVTTNPSDVAILVVIRAAKPE